MTANDAAENEGTKDSSPASDDIEIRPALREDYEDVVAFTQDTWGEDSDYIPDVFHDWLDEQGEGRMTLVAEVSEAIANEATNGDADEATNGDADEATNGDADEATNGDANTGDATDGDAIASDATDGNRIAGLAQGVILSETEAWGQGMRVDPAYRNRGIGRAIALELFDWAREQGCTVMRNMVFSWNEAGLGQSRALGYEPVTEFRWLHPEPTTEPLPDGVSDDGSEAQIDRAWECWRLSTAREVLDGLVLDMDESWALCELTPGMLTRAASETSLLTVNDADRTAGFAFSNRSYDRENDEGETETWVEYGVAAWEDLETCQVLLEAIAADAGNQGADRIRVLIPETPRFVSDAARWRVDLSENPDFVFALDLTE